MHSSYMANRSIYCTCAPSQNKFGPIAKDYFHCIHLYRAFESFLNKAALNISVIFQQRQRKSDNECFFLFLSYLIIQFELGEEFLTADAFDKFSLYGRKVIKGWWVEDIFVAGGRCYLIQLLHVCIGNSDCQDADTCGETEAENNPGESFSHFKSSLSDIHNNNECINFSWPRARAILEGGWTLSWALPSVMRTRTWATSCLMPRDSWNSSCRT